MFAMIRVLVSVLLLALPIVQAASDYTLTIDTSKGLSYIIASTANPAQYWLKSGDSQAIFRNKGETLTVGDNSLVFVNTSTSKGRDVIGSYVRTRVVWTGNTANNPPKESFFETNFRVYDSLGAKNNELAIVFEQRWPTGATDTSNGNSESVFSSFPSFEIPDKPTADHPLGLLQWTGAFSQSYVLQPWALTAEHWPNLCIQNGTGAGPIALFADEGNYNYRTSLMSSFSSFMDVSVQQVGNELRNGMMGSMKYVPANYAADTILYLAPLILTEAANAWGDTLLRFYGKSKAATYGEDQLSTNWIGYATDNGAYYYYNHEPSKTYEQTMHDVKDEFAKIRFPYRFMQLDSWWYPKGVNQGTKNWTAMPSIFPSGLVELHKSLGDMPFVAHNRYWAPDTDYAKQNGGDYDWIVESQFSLPTEQRFWDDLFVNASKWGLITYEQDWLFTEDDGLKALTETPGLGRQWLTQMGRGAEKQHINIQYCMNYPRFLLQSVEIPAVRQARASNDYEPANEKWNNWEVGLTGILLGALGIAPHKDTFLTNVSEPGNPYNVKGEPLPDFQAALSTISGGPVMPGSGLAFTNWTLLHYSIRADGLIMRGDRAATFPDLMLYQYVFDRQSDAAPTLEDNYAMYTTANGRNIAIKPKTQGCSSLKPSQLESQTCLEVQKVDEKQHQVTVRSFYPSVTAADSAICGWEWTGSSIVILPLYVGGERFKWVPTSPQRMVRWENGNLTLTGAPNEKVEFEHADISKTPAIQYADPCQLDEHGHATLDYDMNDLSQYYCNGVLMQSQVIGGLALCDDSFPMPPVTWLPPHKPSSLVDDKVVMADQ